MRRKAKPAGFGLGRGSPARGNSNEAAPRLLSNDDGFSDAEVELQDLAVAAAVQDFEHESDAEYESDDFDDEHGFSEIFVRDGPEAGQPLPAGLTDDEDEDGSIDGDSTPAVDMGGGNIIDADEATTARSRANLKRTAWTKGITNIPSGAHRYAAGSNKPHGDLFSRLRMTAFGRNFYHMRYPLVVLTMSIQVVFHVLGVLTGVAYVNSTFLMLNDTGDETIIFLGETGDNTTKHVVDGVMYQNLGGVLPSFLGTAAAILVAQIVIDVCILLHVLTFVRRISLRVAFTFLMSAILSFAFYFEYMDMIQRIEGNTSAFVDIHLADPCTRSQTVLQVYMRYLYFSIETVTSTGYGDVTPAYLSTRIVATIEMFLGTRDGYPVTACFVEIVSRSGHA